MMDDKKHICAKCKNDLATADDPAEATALFIGKFWSEYSQKVVQYRGWLCDMHANQAEAGKFVPHTIRVSQQKQELITEINKLMELDVDTVGSLKEWQVQIEKWNGLNSLDYGDLVRLANHFRSVANSASAK